MHFTLHNNIRQCGKKVGLGHGEEICITCIACIAIFWRFSEHEPSRTLSGFLMFSDSSKIRNPSMSPCSSRRMRTHVVEADDFCIFLPPSVEDTISNTQCLPAIFRVENLSRAGRVQEEQQMLAMSAAKTEPHLSVPCLDVHFLTKLCLTIWSLSQLQKLQGNPVVRLDGTGTCTARRNGTMLGQYGAKA